MAKAQLLRLALFCALLGTAYGGSMVPSLNCCETTQTHAPIDEYNTNSFMLECLNFVKSVVDSEDLPLNFSRVTLQQNQIFRVIMKIFVKMFPETFAVITEEKADCKKFYEQYGKCLKLRVQEDYGILIITGESVAAVSSSSRACAWWTPSMSTLFRS